MWPLLVVTTMLGGRGTTGVETHLNQVLQTAEGLGHRTKLVTPYTGPRWLRAFFRPLKNQRPERARVLYRAAQGWLIEAQLARLRRRSTEPTTVYAQCPMSARGALNVAQHSPDWRVILVVHYNGSESSEVIDKGIAQRGGPWTRDLDDVERAVLPRVSKIVFVSDYMRRNVNARLPEIAHVPQETIMNFAPEPDRRPADVNGDIIAIGTLQPRKNQSFLLKVLAKARERGADYSLTLVGDGPDRKNLEQLRNSSRWAIGFVFWDSARTRRNSYRSIEFLRTQPRLRIAPSRSSKASLTDDLFSRRRSEGFPRSSATRLKVTSGTCAIQAWRQVV